MTPEAPTLGAAGLEYAVGARATSSFMSWLGPVAVVSGNEPGREQIQAQERPVPTHLMQRTGGNALQDDCRRRGRSLRCRPSRAAPPPYPTVLQVVRRASRRANHISCSSNESCTIAGRDSLSRAGRVLKKQGIGNSRFVVRLPLLSDHGIEVPARVPMAKNIGSGSL